jgi:flagellar assembly factor FliW
MPLRPLERGSLEQAFWIICKEQIMKTAATLEHRRQPRWPGSKDSILRFEEGLIGLSECKDFVLMETEDLSPFRLLQSIEKPDIGFLVVEPQAVMRDYYTIVPQREWETVRLTNPADYLAFVICVIGSKPSESTGNFQAPLIINHRKMIGKQVILTDCGLSVRQPLL